MSVASRNGRPLFHDLYAAADDPGFLQPLGAITFVVPCSADTNLWHVSVDLQEVSAARPKWRRVSAEILRFVGFHMLDDKTYNVSSPAFGTGEQ